LSNYRDSTVDFIVRTRSNLALIQARKLDVGEERFEVTQLINSLLGLLVMPQQQEIFRQGVYMLRNLERDGWTFPRPAQGYHNKTELSAMLRLMRNSIAHWGLSFIERNGEISDIVMVNKNDDTGNICWRAQMSVPELRCFVERLSELAISIVKN